MYAEVPVVEEYRYHGGNFQSLGKAGRYPNISAKQLKAVNDVQAALEQDGYWDKFNEDNLDNLCYEPVFLKLVRFVRSMKFDVKVSIDLIKEDVDWRMANDEEILYIRHKNCNDILKVDYATEVYRYFPTWLQNFDKQGRPVCYRVFGHLDVPSLVNTLGLDTLVKFHVFESEMALRAADCSSRKLGRNIESLTVVVDAADWGLHLATSDAVAFIKRMVAADNKHYVERMGQMLIINAPWTLSGVWAMISPILDPDTKAKIQIISSKDSWQKKLFEIVDRDKVPEMFGGTAPNLTPLQMAMSFSTAGLEPKEQRAVERAYIQQRKAMFPHLAHEHPDVEVDEHGKEKLPFRSRFIIDNGSTDAKEMPITKGRMRAWFDRAHKLGLFKGERERRQSLSSGFSSSALSFLGDAGGRGGRGDSSNQGRSKVIMKPPVKLRNGDKYSGGWLQSKFEGDGILERPNGTNYTGSFKGGLFHGRGKYTYTNSKTFRGKYGNTYEGRFVEGDFDDVDGVMHIVGGVSYRGGFKKGVKHGKGKLVQSDGKIVRGVFVDDDCPHGEVTYLNHVREHYIAVPDSTHTPAQTQTQAHANDDTDLLQERMVMSYQGDLRYGLRHGSGTVTFSDGTALAGRFKSDDYLTPKKKLVNFLSKC